jgi:hypothetical protein
MVDYLDVYHDILAHYQILSSCFVLGELIMPLANNIKQLSEGGVECISISGLINSAELHVAIRCYNMDILILIAGNQIFKNEFIALALKSCLNLYTALLPE